MSPDPKTEWRTRHDINGHSDHWEIFIAVEWYCRLVGATTIGANGRATTSGHVLNLVIYAPPRHVFQNPVWRLTPVVHQIAKPLGDVEVGPKFTAFVNFITEPPMTRVDYGALLGNQISGLGTIYEAPQQALSSNA